MASLFSHHANISMSLKKTSWSLIAWWKWSRVELSLFRGFSIFYYYCKYRIKKIKRSLKMMPSISVLASNFSLLGILLLIYFKTPDFSFSWNIFDGSRLISVVMRDCFEARNRDSEPFSWAGNGPSACTVLQLKTVTVPCLCQFSHDHSLLYCKLTTVPHSHHWSCHRVTHCWLLWEYAIFDLLAVDFWP